MKQELKAAVNFLAKPLTNQENITNKQIELFKECLIYILYQRYRDHWIPERPHLYSSYRCILIGEKIEPMILRACIISRISVESLTKAYKPHVLILFIDPYDVYYSLIPDKTKRSIFQCDPQPPAPTKKHSPHCTII